MTELQKAWQTIDRSIGYIQGFVPVIWALDAVQGERELIAAESIGAFDDVVSELATAIARARELTEVRE